MDEGAVAVQSPMRYVAAGLYLLLAGAGGAGAFIADSGVRRILGGLLAVLFVVVGCRTVRSGLWCAPAGVTVRDELRTRTFAWEAIERFQEHGLKGIGAVMTGGRWVRLVYYATLGDESPEIATRRLEAARERYQSEK